MEFHELTEAEQEDVKAALIFFGEDPESAPEVDLCESGQVYLGLIEIMPRGSIQYVFEGEAITPGNPALTMWPKS